MTEAAAVSVRGLQKRFGTSTALHAIDFDVAPRELVVLVGRSGSGKSTLLRCLNGLQPTTAGEIHVLGTRVDGARRPELRRLRRHIGFVFQQFNLVGRLSVLENVLIGALGRLRGPRYGVLTYSRALRQDALDCLERVDLADRPFQRADTLSGGQQQRVAIARTLMHRPSLLLADEPVASLDPENAAVVMDLLFRVCVEEGITVVCSLHQVDLALSWAHRVVGLHEGQKVLDLPASKVTKEQVMRVYQGNAPVAVPLRAASA